DGCRVGGDPQKILDRIGEAVRPCVESCGRVGNDPGSIGDRSPVERQGADGNRGRVDGAVGRRVVGNHAEEGGNAGLGHNRVVVGNRQHDGGGGRHSHNGGVGGYSQVVIDRVGKASARKGGGRGEGDYAGQIIHEDRALCRGNYARGYRARVEQVARGCNVVGQHVDGDGGAAGSCGGCIVIGHRRSVRHGYIDSAGSGNGAQVVADCIGEGAYPGEAGSRGKGDVAEVILRDSPLKC